MLNSISMANQSLRKLEGYHAVDEQQPFASGWSDVIGVAHGSGD
jgi:hypothetical protein